MTFGAHAGGSCDYSRPGWDILLFEYRRGELLERGKSSEKGSKDYYLSAFAGATAFFHALLKDLPRVQGWVPQEVEIEKRNLV